MLIVTDRLILVPLPQLQASHRYRTFYASLLSSPLFCETAFGPSPPRTLPIPTNSSKAHTTPLTHIPTKKSRPSSIASSRPPGPSALSATLDSLCVRLLSLPLSQRTRGRNDGRRRRRISNGSATSRSGTRRPLPSLTSAHNVKPLRGSSSWYRRTQRGRRWSRSSMGLRRRSGGGDTCQRERGRCRSGEWRGGE